jgi:hypothetical protein
LKNDQFSPKYVKARSIPEGTKGKKKPGCVDFFGNPQTETWLIFILHNKNPSSDITGRRNTLFCISPWAVSIISFFL